MIRHHKQLSPEVLDKTQHVHDSPLIERELEMNKFFLYNHFVLQILIKSSIQIVLINFLIIYLIQLLIKDLK